MSEPFLAEIKIVGFNFPPRGWAFCDGQILPINQNQSLYSLLGTTYGGDGRTTFALPGLRGRAPIHVGTFNGVRHSLGEKGGVETHSLSESEMASHAHVVQIKDADGQGTQPGSDPVLSRSKYETRYTNTEPTDRMASGNVANQGGGQVHENMQPSIVLNYCIALTGLFPSRN